MQPEYEAHIAARDMVFPLEGHLSDRGFSLSGTFAVLASCRGGKLLEQDMEWECARCTFHDSQRGYRKKTRPFLRVVV